MSEREPSGLSASVRLGDGVWVTCHRYPHRLPILAINDLSVSLTLTSPHERSASAADLATARELLAAVRTYVAECERFASDAVPADPAAA